MTAEELDKCLTVARKHRCQQITINGMTAVFLPDAIAEPSMDMAGLKKGLTHDDIAEAEAQGLLYASAG